MKKTIHIIKVLVLIKVCVLINFAVSLARYYNTSTDYILCNTDIKSPDVTISDICIKTGLSEKAIIRLNTTV